MSAILSLLEQYQKDQLRPEDALQVAQEQINAHPNAVIQSIPLEPYLSQLRSLPCDRQHPLWGIPFVIKDNIDLPSNQPQLAAWLCYTPEESATAVRSL